MLQYHVHSPVFVHSSFQHLFTFGNRKSFVCWTQLQKSKCKLYSFFFAVIFFKIRMIRTLLRCLKDLIGKSQIMWEYAKSSNPFESGTGLCEQCYASSKNEEKRTEPNTREKSAWLNRQFAKCQKINKTKNGKEGQRAYPRRISKMCSSIDFAKNESTQEMFYMFNAQFFHCVT